MNEDPKKDRQALDQLADALADDVLNASDEAILAETTEDHGDPGEVAGQMRALFERTIQERGKEKLAAARAAATEARRKNQNVVDINAVEARRRYEAIVANDAGLARKLTLAARKGQGQSERDIDSAIEDLAELGALDEDKAEDR